MSERLTAEELTLGTLLPKMDRIREYAHKNGDIILAAEVDDWYREHAATLRRIRDLTEDF